MPTLAIKSGTTAIAGSTVKGSFSYFSGSTKDLGPTNVTGFYSGVDAPPLGYTVYQIGGSGGWTARVATDTTSLNSILISAGGTGSTVAQNITWATNTNSVYINSGATTVSVGQSALGGIVAYTTNGGTTGFVVGTTDLGSYQWRCSGTFLGATGTAIGTGLSNTNIMLTNCATRPSPASVAVGYNGGGYNDWYLPSSSELQILISNYALFGLSGSLVYWSSSEISTTQAYFGQNYGSLIYGGSKTQSYLVRPIRSF